MVDANTIITISIGLIVSLIGFVIKGMQTRMDENFKELFDKLDNKVSQDQCQERRLSHDGIHKLEKDNDDEDKARIGNDINGIGRRISVLHPGS